MNIIEVVNNNISYQVHPATELFGIIAIIAEDSDLFKEAGDEYYNKNYRDEILERFSPFKNHPAVVLISQYAKQYHFNYDAPCAFFLELLDNKHGFSAYIRKERLPISEQEFRVLREEINNFIEEINFEEFYHLNESRYKKSITAFIRQTKDVSPEKYLFAFTGYKLDNLAINLMHSVCNSNYGLVTEKKTYTCIMPHSESDEPGEPSFISSMPSVTSLILHEFAHSFINPLTREHGHIVKNIDREVFSKTLAMNSYGDDLETAINETIIRSLECEYIREMFPEAYDSFLASNISQGFIQIPPVLAKLNEYKNNRNTYPTINEFYRNLLGIFL